jgi:hypothetical protein
MHSIAIEDLRATLHPASGRRGLIILGSPGFEDLCAHRFLTALGEESARLGVPALRFDLRGMGESMPAIADRALVDEWVNDLGHVARWMQRELNCCEFAVAGLRLGSLLAAGALVDPIFEGARLALLAPPASGKAYLRELKVFARVVAAPPTAPDLDGLDLAGFHLPQALAEGVGALDWSGLATGPARDVLVCGPATASLKYALEAGQHRVEVTDFAGYERLMCDPTASVVPGSVVRQVANWLTQAAPLGIKRSAVPRSASISTNAWRETGVSFGAGGGTDGILCEPRGSAGGPLVIFTNPGGIRRTGWGNMWVDMARDLAASSVASLRFDFSNLTADLDSDEPAFHYGETVWGEVAEAVNFVTTQGFGPVIVVGACSGAYHCLRAATSDPRIEGVVLVNQLCYEWSPAHALPLAAWMRQKPSDFDRKRRAVDDETSDLARLGAQLLVQGVTLAKRSAKGALRQLRALSTLLPVGGQGAGASTEQTFRDLAARGCRIEVVQTAGDPSVLEFDRAVGLADGALPGLTRTIVADADHLLTPRAARQVVLGRIEAVAATMRSIPERRAMRT